MRGIFHLFLVPAVLLASASWAEDHATPDEAKAMAIDAAEYLKAVGPDKAFPEFDAKDSRWHDRDLYVAVTDGKGFNVAHGANPGLIGRNVLDLKDPDGKAFIRETITIKDQGWVNYRWLNPVTKVLESKAMYQVRVGNYLVGVGAYAK